MASRTAEAPAASAGHFPVRRDTTGVTVSVCSFPSPSRGRHACQQRLPQFRDRLQPVFRQQCQRSVDRLQKGVRVASAADNRGRLQGIGFFGGVRLDAGRRFRRRTPAYAGVENRAHPVDVGPLALTALRRILFYGRIAGCQDRSHGAADIADCLPRRAEIQQDRSAVRPQKDIGRLDVAVKEPRLMHGIQAVQQRLGYRRQFRGGYRAAPSLQMIAKAHALLVAHDDVGGFIGFE